MIPYSTPKLSDFYSWFSHDAGLKIATDTVANATKISSLMTKNSGSVATLATRFLYDLDTNTLNKHLSFHFKTKGPNRHIEWTEFSDRKQTKPNRLLFW